MRFNPKLANEFLEARGIPYRWSTWSPGDGVTRYRLGTAYRYDMEHAFRDTADSYDGCKPILTVLGSQAALDAQRAFLVGFTLARTGDTSV